MRRQFPRRISMHALRIITVVLFLGACRAAEAPVDEVARSDAESSAARPEIEVATATFYKWLNAGALDSAATGVTEDYVWLPPNAPADSGRANWVRVNTAMLASGKFAGAVTIDAVVASGPIAVARGRYVSTFTPGSGAPKGAKTVADTGKVHWQLRKLDGRWLLSVASWNSDLPVGR